MADLWSLGISGRPAFYGWPIGFEQAIPRTRITALGGANVIDKRKLCVVAREIIWRADGSIGVCRIDRDLIDLAVNGDFKRRIAGDR